MGVLVLPTRRETTTTTSEGGLFTDPSRHALDDTEE
jgi:hypothetical protein